jgi:DNA-directed RNA polymerase subunit omega
MRSSKGIIEPPIDELVDKVDSKYQLVIVASKRARQINDYYQERAEGTVNTAGPLVESTIDEKPLTIAMREINEGLVELSRDN